MTSKALSSTTTTSSSNTSSTTSELPKGYEMIEEGTVKMMYPSGVVFYNPVQVQNRDLSVLMIQLHGERRFKRFQMQIRKREILKQLRLDWELQQQQAPQDTNENDNHDNNNNHDNHDDNKQRPKGKSKKKKGPRIDESIVAQKLNEYESNTDWVAEYQKAIIMNSTNGQTQNDDDNSIINNNINDTEHDDNNKNQKDNHNHKHKNTTNVYQGMRILDALAASGLRSLRYWNEIPGVHSVTINDLDPAAVDLAKKNVDFNHLSKYLIHSNDDAHNGNNNIDNNNNNHNNNDNNNHPNQKSGLQIHVGDATHLMYNSRRPPSLRPNTFNPSQFHQNPQYSIIDLDPYGSASPFLDAAIQSIEHRGMLNVTCTDMAVLGGSHPETCYGRYGAMPLPRAPYLQELAVRILLYSLAITAARYGRTIRPILSVGMNFYVRVFVEVWDDKAGVNNLSLNIGTVYQSSQCPSFHIIPHGKHPSHNPNLLQTTRAPAYPTCQETGGPFKTAGPCWIGPMHDKDVVHTAIERLEELELRKVQDGVKVKSKSNTNTNTMTTPTTTTTTSTTTTTKRQRHPLATGKQIHGMLTVVSEELTHAPLYYVLPDLCHTLGCPSPPIDSVRAALVNAGYNVSSYHKEAQAIKTDAPNLVVWDVMRAWCRKNHPLLMSNGGKKDGGGGGGGENTNGDVMEEDDTEESKRRLRKMKKEENKKRRKEAMRARRKKARKNGNGGDVEDNNNVDENDDDKETTENEETTNNVVVLHVPVSEKILAVEPVTKIDFTIPKVVKQKKKACRFPMNPQSHWGPKPRAVGYVKNDASEKEEDK
eukprot:CAMPEP_0184856584 /NCGR_PEP_ID=MMETSP0580-20130426/1768_1 /TAXON_ID=1118495 /ORGANISM="Dactyliosolen fragilissimus" /LENGTH=816 /DNA_ID=CAMNT_0027351687 /DNA_START=425 /DNA_END=2875 /DNA_ORIENTATION=-